MLQVYYSIDNMPSDRYDYISPTKVKVLVVPINNCYRDDFGYYLKLIRSSKEIRLLDVTPMNELKYFNPQTFPNGRILYEFNSTVADSESIFLHDFEPFRKTFVVIGVGKYTLGIENQQNHFLLELKRLYPSTIAQSTIIFDTPSDIISQLNPPSDHSMKYAFYNGSIHKSLADLNSIICEITRNFLFSLDDYVQSYQNITLRSPVSITDSQLLTKTISKAQKRLSSSSSLKVPFSHNSTSSSATNLNQADLKNKSQVIHSGRQSKLLGSFYLLAGKYSDSLINFTEAVLYLRKSDDYMWLASALEGMCISIIMLNYVKVNYQLPNAILATILQLSKSKIRDLSVESNGSHNKKVSEEPAISGSPTQNGKKNVGASPRTSTSSNASFNLPTALPASAHSTSGPDLSVIPLPELIKQILYKVNYYFQLSADDYENTVPDLVYVESLLRAIKLMILIYRHGHNDETFYEMVVQQKPIDHNHLAGSWIGKQEIVKEIDKIFSIQIRDMDLLQQCRIYSCLATIYNDIQMKRKMAFVLRILLVAILPNLQQQWLNTKEEFIIDDFTNDFSQVSTESINNDKFPAVFNDRSSIREIADLLLHVYNLDAEPECSLQESQGWNSIHLLLLKLCIEIFDAVEDYSSLVNLYCLILTRYTHCLPTDDQVRLKQRATNLIEYSIKNNLQLSLPYSDPFFIRNVKLINNRSKDELISFDDTNNKTSLNVDFDDPSKQEEPQNGSSTSVNQPFVFDPFNKPKPKSFNKDKLLIQEEIYQLRVTVQNAFSFPIEINDIEVVTTEANQIETLNSTYKIGNTNLGLSPNNAKLSAFSLRLALDGKHRSEPKLNEKGSSVSTPNLLNVPTPMSNTLNYNDNKDSSLVIQPRTIDSIIISFKPKKTGEINITGLNAVIGPCENQFFPIVDKENGVELQKIKCSDKPFLNSIERAGTNLLNNDNNQRISPKTILLNVVQPQPSLTLIDLLITNGWLMLLEGEKYQFSVYLSNQSEKMINYLSFSFWDSTIQSLNKRLSTNTHFMSPIDIYEMEWYLLKCKSFQIKNRDQITEKYRSIKGYGDVKIDYEINAKRGMTDLKIILEYSNKIGDNLEQNYFKTLEIPLELSVWPSIELITFDILPLLFSNSNELFPNFESVDEGMNNNLYQVEQFIRDQVGEKSLTISDYCVVVLDLRNSWSKELEIDIEFESSKDKKFDLKDIIRPRTTVRYFLPMQRISSLNYDLKKPIPSLRKKQYVKNYLVSDQEEMEIREAFWLRDIWLNKIKGSWKSISVDDVRQGNINFRSMRLTSTMTNILVYPKIKVLHKLFKESQPHINLERKGSQFHLDLDEFYTIKTCITNYSDNNIHGILRHIPFAIPNSNYGPSRDQLNLSKKVLINGLLQAPLPTDIKPQQSLEIETSFVIIEKGEYEWGTLLDITENEEISKVVGREHLCFLVS